MNLTNQVVSSLAASASRDNERLRKAFSEMLATLGLQRTRSQWELDGNNDRANADVKSFVERISGHMAMTDGCESRLRAAIGAEAEGKSMDELVTLVEQMLGEPAEGAKDGIGVDRTNGGGGGRNGAAQRRAKGRG